MAALSSDLIATKVAPPTWQGDKLRRDALLSRLDAALDRRLTLIHAPAGFGKTSLLTQWRDHLELCSVQVAWLTLEDEDGELQRFAQYIALAIDGASRIDGSLDDAEPASDVPPRANLSAIINGLLSQSRRVVLILDEYHCADTTPVREFLLTLLKLAPSHFHLVISSRDYPQIGQAVFAAEDQVLDFSQEDLKFSPSEAGAMLSRANDVDLDEDEIRTVVDRAEGWPIALQLTYLSLKRGADRKKIVQHISRPNSDLSHYLTEQVFTTLSPESQAIVSRTALLDRVTGEAVDLLCDRQDGWLMLERLEQQGVLLSPTSAERLAYRYHQLFAEHLRDRLEQSDRNLFTRLHERLARWFLGRGELHEAVNHAIITLDHQLIAETLENAGGWRLILTGLQSTVERGLGSLPTALIDNRPALVLARVYLQVKHGELVNARRDFDRLLASVGTRETSPDLRTEIQVVGNALASYENAPVSLDDLVAREALLRTLPMSEHLTVGNISETLGAKYLEGGWLERALEPILQARAHYQAIGSLYSEIFTQFLEARLKHAQGRLKDSAKILATAREHIHQTFGARSDIAANCSAFEAELMYEQNQLAEAGALLDWALPHMEQSDGWVDVYATAYGTAMRAAAASGSIATARAFAERGRRLAQHRRLEQLDLLISLYELELLIHYKPSIEPARVLADGVGLDDLADAMAEEAPKFRPASTAAAVCRAKILLRSGDVEPALVELAGLKQWALRHGAGRYQVDVDIIIAYGLHVSGKATAARAAFDEAVGQSMFQGSVRPFLDAALFVKPLLADARSTDVGMNRFRARFLQGLGKAIAAQPVALMRQGALTDTEAEIINHLSRGHSNKEIARLVGVSPDTVKYHLKSLFRKIGVSRRRDAVRVSSERGLIVDVMQDRRTVLK